MSDASTTTGFALNMTSVGKRFGQALVLDDVTFRVGRGRVHGLVGHNGAGKSTLMKIALGSVPPSSGTVDVGETRLTFSRPAEARLAGVGMVLQELSLIPTLSVIDNIFLHSEKRSRLGTISTRSQQREARELLRELGISGINLSRPVGELPIAEQQMVEIAKATRLSRRLLILDEPTGPLSRRETVRLFELVRRAADLGLGVVFITHHLREVFEICDEVTVLRDGRVVLHSETSQTSLDRVIEALVGRELASVDAGEDGVPAADAGRTPVLSVDGLAVQDKLSDVSFELFPGEIVGIAGLAGSGRSVLLKAIFGEIRPERGVLTLKGRRYRPRGSADAIARGVFLVPEDRGVHGVIPTHTIEQNVVLPILRQVARLFLYRPRAARREVTRMAKLLGLRATSIRQTVQELSGGNQQKVVFSKALLAEPEVFLLDEPTFGIDIHTAADIIAFVRGEVDSGKAALWVASDLAELLAVSDRILVLVDGTISREIRRGARDFAEEQLLHVIQRSPKEAA